MSLGRLGEAAVRRGIEQDVLQHAAILCDMHMDTSDAVRQAAADALTRVRTAAEKSSGPGISEMLREHIHNHGAVRFAASRPPPRDLDEDASARKLRRAASDGTLAATYHTQHGEKPVSLLRQRVMQTSAKHRWHRPTYQKFVEMDMRDVWDVLDKPNCKEQTAKEQACRLADELESKDAGTRSRAALSLGRLGAAAGAYAGLLRRCLNDSDSFVRAAASIAIGQIEAATGEANNAKPTKGKKRRTGSSTRARSSGTTGSSGSSRPASSSKARPSANASGRAGSSSAPPSRPASAGQARPSSAGAARASRPASAGASRPTQSLARGGQILQGRMRSTSRSRSGRGAARKSPTRPKGINYTIRCLCGFVVERQKCLEGRHAGRFFFGCPQERSSGHRCSFLLWEKD